ncbi:MAG: BT_3987 domain-containing protein [Phocaeicola sp.]
MISYLTKLKAGVYTLLLAGAAVVGTGCEEQVMIGGADGGQFDNIDQVYGYVRSAAGARNLTPISIFGDQPATGHLFFEATKSAQAALTVNFKIDAEALEAYNKKEGTAYEMYPAQHLSLENEGVATIEQGQRKSAGIELAILPGGSVGTTYAVAVSATVSGDLLPASNTQSYIYLVTPKPAIPNSRKGDVLTFCFVEVNDESILNCGEYFMEESGKPFFDVVSIFAANINVNSETGRANIQCNDQVRFVLENVDRLVRPLQEKGIKVNLSILGNHDEAGMGNLSHEAAIDFAKELKAYVDIYGLDGIDFDDEYSRYPATPSPGFDVRSRANYCRFIYECRQAMPDKLLGIYEYLGSFIDSPSGSYEGKSAGELVDYMCYGTYQRYVKGRETNFTGLPRSKYGPFSLKINDEYNGGWRNYSDATMQDLKNEGYGFQMFYNPKPRTYSYDHYFSAVSNILFDEAVTWTGNYYDRTGFAPIKGVKKNYEAYLGEWSGMSSNSLYYLIDEHGVGKWWDWGGSQSFSIRVEEREAGKSYNVYGWGSYPDVTNQYPLVMEYNAYDGSIKISTPQVIHEGDENDPITWEMRQGTYGSGNSWNFNTNTTPITGSIDVQGAITLTGRGNRYGIDPCYLEDGKYVPPTTPIKYHLTENYTLVKK